MTASLQRATDARELLDGPVAPADLAASLRDIDRLNAWFGGYALTLRALRRLGGRPVGDRPLTVVDVGGGRGDLAIRIVRSARRRGHRIRVVVVDHDPATVALARARCGSVAEIVVLRADGTALPFADGGVDVAVSSLTMHHLDPAQVTRCLAEMVRVARAGIVVNDLLRGWLSVALVWTATRLFARHPISRHDGPLSVRRAYSGAELRALADAAGVKDLDVQRHPLLARVLAVA